MAAGDPPTTPPTMTPDLEAQNKAMSEAIELEKAAAGSTQVLGDITNFTSGMLGKFRSVLESVGTQLDHTDKLTERGRLAFMGFGLEAIKAQDSFGKFANLDMSHISTFGGHLNDLSNMLNMGGTTANAAKEKIGGLKDVFVKAGGSGDVFEKALKVGAKAALGLVENMLASADVGIKMQEAQVRLAASTGNLGDLWTKAGGSLQKMSALVADQNKMMNLSMGATNSTSEQIQEYYFALGKVPGALQETTNGMSLLTATIKLAHGTGMDQVQITKDMHEAYKKFGMTGADSIKFISNFSELSQDLHVELDDMREGLIAASDAFRGLVDRGKAAGDMTEGVSRIMKEYVKGLQETGMPSKDAIAAANQMIGAFKGLNVAQRAFLSAQTGGPGGLMGAAKIEQMLRSGDVAGVEKLVMQTLQKQTGKAVTLEEASKSEAAAATRQRQIMLLQQGPLGAMAKTPEDAGRLLESMRARQEGRAGPAAELRTGGLEKAMQAGSTWEKQTHTVVSDMATDVAGIRDELAVMSANTLKGALTSAPTGDPRMEQRLTDAERRSRRDLDERMARDAREGSKQAGLVAQDMAKKGVLTTDRQPQYEKESLRKAIGTMATVPTVVSRIGAVAGRAADVARGKEEGPSEADQRKALTMETEQRRSSTARQEMQQRMTPGGAAAPTKRAFKLPDISTTVLDPTDPRFGESPAARVAAAPRGTPRARPAATAVPGGAAPEVSVTEAGNTGRIKVDVQVKVNEVSTNANAINPATGT